MKIKPILTGMFALFFLITCLLIILIIFLLIFIIPMGSFENKALAEKYSALKDNDRTKCERYNNFGIIKNANHSVEILSSNEAKCDDRYVNIIPYSSAGILAWDDTYVIDCDEVYWIFYSGSTGPKYWGPFNSSGCIPLLEGGISYADCIANITAKEREKIGILKPAKDEPINAVRIDSKGNYWIKTSDNMWYSNSSGYNNTRWGPSLIDKQPGGIDYDPIKDMNTSLCEPYR